MTPKVAVAAIVGNERGEILLTQRADSGFWLYPVGWADVGYSASEVAVKEVYEETGIEVEPVSLIGVLDGLRLGFTHIPMYSLVFHCRMLGGELRGHPLETRAVGFYPRDALPQPLAGVHRWGELAFRAIDGEQFPADFDRRARRPGARRRPPRGRAEQAEPARAERRFSRRAASVSSVRRSEHATPVAALPLVADGVVVDEPVQRGRRPGSARRPVPPPRPARARRRTPGSTPARPTGRRARPAPCPTGSAVGSPPAASAPTTASQRS